MCILPAYEFTPLLLLRENRVRAQGPRICLKLSAYCFYTTKPTYICYLNIVHTVLRLRIDGENFSLPL